MAFNSKEYSWVNVSVVLFGQPVIGCRGIEYKPKMAKEAMYAMGKRAYSIQCGKREYEGTLTITQSELAALNRSAVAKGYDDVLDLEMDIVVSYVDNGIVTTDRIQNATFTEAPMSMKEGDMYMEVALPFIALDVKHDI